MFRHKKDWKKFELKNKSIALNMLFVPYNTKEIRHTRNQKVCYICKKEFSPDDDNKKYHKVFVI